MNIYFIVEGKTEEKVYEKWLDYLIPELERVKYFDEVLENNYYIFNSCGYPALLHHISNSIRDVNHVGRYDYFVVCTDAV